MYRMESNRAFNTARSMVGGLAVGLLVTAGLNTTASAQQYNAAGWTVLQPAEDTRFVFVSSSEGNDQNNGRTPANAVRTIGRAKQLMRDNAPDWMLLRRGDTWTQPIGVWTFSGRSEQERVVIASYGDSPERPKLILTDESGITSVYARDTSHVAIVGLHFEAIRPQKTGSRGIRWLSTGEDLLIEDCYIDGFKDNVTIEGQGENGFQNARMRRNVIVDAWATDSHAQGVYVSNTTGVLLEENIIDHNGWNPDVPGAGATTYKQNVYLQTSTFDVEFIGNLTSRASAAGAQLRTGGLAINNLFYANPMNLRFGYFSNSTSNNPLSSGEIRGNVVTGGPVATDEGGWGIWVERTDGATISGNVITQLGNGTHPWAFVLTGLVSNTELTENIASEWTTAGGGGSALRSSASAGDNVVISNNVWSSLSATSHLVHVITPDNIAFRNNKIMSPNSAQPLFRVGNSSMVHNQWLAQPTVQNDTMYPSNLPTSGRNLGTYARSLGFTDETAFLEAARQLNRRTWRPELTGAAAAEWIRAGYFQDGD